MTMRVLAGWGQEYPDYQDIPITSLEEFYALLWGLEFNGDLRADRTLSISTKRDDEYGECIVIRIKDEPNGRPE